MPTKRPVKNTPKSGLKHPSRNAQERRGYYREVWGFDPVADRIDLGHGEFRYETWFSLASDPALEAAGIEIGARVDCTRQWKIQNRIVFRKDRQEATVECTHTVALAGPAQDMLTLASDLLVRHGALEPESKKLLQAAGGPVVLPPAEHFAALKSYVAAVAETGIGNMLWAAWSMNLVAGAKPLGDAAELPFGFNSAMQAQVIRALQDVAMAAWEGILADWVAQLLDTASPAALVTMREPLNQMLTGADLAKVFQDANLPPEEEEQARREWMLEPTEEGSLGERLAYRGHPIGLDRAFELLWRRADRDWWAAHRKQIEALFDERDEVVGRSFAPSAVIRSTGERVVVDEGGKLDLSQRGITSLADVDFSGCAGAVRNLLLNDNEIQRIENLDQLFGLERLNLRNNHIKQIENLEVLASSIQVLSLGSNQITTMESINKLTNLSALYLSNNLISKIENIDTCTKLKNLDLSGNQITRIEGISKCIQLERLNLANNQFTTIEGLIECKNLSWLYLESNKISKINGLNVSKNIQALDLSNNGITTMENLSFPSNLQRLNLEKNKIVKIQGLEKNLELTTLNLNDNKIRSLSGLGNLRKLELLNVEKNEIENIDDVKKLETLQLLNLADNKIFNLIEIENLTNLSILDVSNNPIRDFSPLLKLKCLKELALRNYRDLDLAIFSSLLNLRWLAFNDSIIGSLEPISNLKELEWVDLRGSTVPSLEPLAKLPNLKGIEVGRAIIGDRDSIAALRRVLRYSPG